MIYFRSFFSLCDTSCHVRSTSWHDESLPVHLRCTCCLKHLQSRGSSWLTLSDLPKTLHDMFETSSSLFDTLPDEFETPWHIVTFLNYWRLLLSVWGIYLFETLPYFESVPGLFEMICDGWDAVSLIVTLCVWKGKTLLKHVSKHVFENVNVFERVKYVWNTSWQFETLPNRWHFS